jgi:hypothetical protein
MDTDKTQLDNYFEKKIELKQLNPNIKEKVETENLNEIIEDINVAYKDLIIALITDEGDKGDDEINKKIIIQLQKIIINATDDKLILEKKGYVEDLEKLSEAANRKFREMQTRDEERVQKLDDKLRGLTGYKSNAENNNETNTDEMEVIDRLVATLENTKKNNPSGLERNLGDLDDTGTDTDSSEFERNSSEFKRKITNYRKKNNKV